jgi:molybdopterin molybdotransferase
MATLYHAGPSAPPPARDNASMAEALISVARAREIAIEAARERVLGTERVAIADALDRVLAADLLAAGDVPPFACSAMDGYAIESGLDGRKLQVVGESRAGTPSDRELGPGQAIRISTGAAVPPGADAVIRQEDVTADDDRIELHRPAAAGENIRGAGEDLRAGVTALTSGATLGVPELGVAVAAGAGHLTVARRPRVAVLCTGDELKAPGEPLGPGEIHNSNAPMLISLSVRCGAQTAPVIRLGDDLQTTEDALAQALEHADVTVVSGGMSVGPHDHVKPALAALGVEELFWGVALQPGKPTGLGVRGDRLVFGLPGNPVSAVVTFSLFVVPALAALQGAADRQRWLGEAELAVAIPRNPRRDQAVRVTLERHGASTLAHPTGPQGSHIVTSLLLADALAVVPAGEGDLAAGSDVELVALPR